MEIYILRHGEAEQRDTGKRDADRKLTAKGKRDVRDVVTVARRAKVDPQFIFTSPLRRAQETAAVVATVFHDCPVTVTDHLVPSAEPGGIWKEIREHSRVVLVGHEPHLSEVIAYLLQSPIPINLKKGALVRIDSEAGDTPQGTLQWIITPRLARAL